MRQQHQQMRKITPQYQDYQNDSEPMTEGGVEWAEFEIENIVNNEERAVIVHAAAGIVRPENGYKEENDKKKKKKSVARLTMYILYSKDVEMFYRLTMTQVTHQKCIFSSEESFREKACNATLYSRIKLIKHKAFHLNLSIATSQSREIKKKATLRLLIEHCDNIAGLALKSVLKDHHLEASVS